MNVSDLSGEKLDYWVSVAEGMKKGRTNYVAYSTLWAVGGPIVEREKIKLEPIHNLRGGEFMYWNAKALPWMYEMEGETPLLAAMRAYVASKFGLEVPDDSPSR